MNQTLFVLCLHNNIILTEDFRFLFGDPDSDQLMDTQTGEVFTIEDCTVGYNGRLDTLTVR